MSNPVDPQVLIEAGTATIPFLPSAQPLEPRALPPGELGAGPNDPAIATSYVGAGSADVAMAAGPELIQALADAEGLTLSDALRPAVEAAVAVLGVGVLDTPQETIAADAFAGDDWAVVALEASGQAYAWLGMRLKGEANDASNMAVAEQDGAGGSGPGAGGASTPRVPPQPSTPASRAEALRMLYDVDMTLTAEIGRTKLSVREVIDLMPGSVIELDRSAGSPADVMVNGRLIARGEIVIVDEEYGIRVTEILSVTDVTE